MGQGKPSVAGNLEAGLARLHDRMAGHVQRGTAPGLVTLVGVQGQVHVDAMGTLAFGGGDPVRRDTIFRITSMTKPITAAATMALVEDGTLGVDEPVDRLLPELANRRVLRRIDGPLDDTVAAKRPITARDLLTFRLGFGNPPVMPNTYPIQKAEGALGIRTLGPPTPPTPHPPDEWLRRFATLPLMYQPGEKWMYNTGASLLGVLIARASGQTLETFLRERFFEPLGMKDTAFSVPPSKLDRFTTAYRAEPGTANLAVFDEARGQWSHPPAFPDGAAGLVSTVDDYAAFAGMLLGKGSWNGKRCLSAASVEMMTTNQLTPEQKSGTEMFLGERGWGFGMSVTVRPDAVSPAPGRYGWDGGYGTSWATDPKKELVGIIMTQRVWDSPTPPEVCRDFWQAVGEATAANAPA